MQSKQNSQMSQIFSKNMNCLNANTVQAPIMQGVSSKHSVMSQMVQPVTQNYFETQGLASKRTCLTVTGQVFDTGIENPIQSKDSLNFDKLEVCQRTMSKNSIINHFQEEINAQVKLMSKNSNFGNMSPHLTKNNAVMMEDILSKTIDAKQYPGY